jgi:hypothetical protein
MSKLREDLEVQLVLNVEYILAMFGGKNVQG